MGAAGVTARRVLGSTSVTSGRSNSRVRGRPANARRVASRVVGEALANAGADGVILQPAVYWSQPRDTLGPLVPDAILDYLRERSQSLEEISTVCPSEWKNGNKI